MTLKRTFMAGIIGAVIAFLFTFLTDGYLFSWVYSIMPGATMWKEMTGLWYVWAIIITLVVHIIFAFVYAILQESIPGIRLSKGVAFGIIFWLLSILPYSLSVLITLKMHSIIPVYWLITGLIKYILVGLVFAFILTEKA